MREEYKQITKLTEENNKLIKDLSNLAKLKFDKIPTNLGVDIVEENKS